MVIHKINMCGDEALDYVLTLSYNKEKNRMEDLSKLYDDWFEHCIGDDKDMSRDELNTMISLLQKKDPILALLQHIKEELAEFTNVTGQIDGPTVEIKDRIDIAIKERTAYNFIWNQNSIWNQ